MGKQHSGGGRRKLAASRYHLPASGWNYNLAPWRDGFHFTSMDSTVFEPGELVDVNLYVYAGENPIARSDPSGRFDIATLLSTQGIQNIIDEGVGRIGQAVRIYNSVQNLVTYLDYLQFAVDLASAFTQPTLAGVGSAVGALLMKEFGISGPTDIVSSFNTALSKITSNWTSIAKAIERKAPTIAAEAAQRMLGAKKKLLSGGRFEPIIYLPSAPGPYKNDKYVEIKDKVKLGISSTLTGGRLFGFGYVTGNDQPVQVFRIDYWDERPYGGGINNDQFRPTITPLHVHYHLFGDNGHVGGPDRTIWP